jgi:hypothetical protein
MTPEAPKVRPDCRCHEAAPAAASLKKSSPFWSFWSPQEGQVIKEGIARFFASPPRAARQLQGPEEDKQELLHRL